MCPREAINTKDIRPKILLVGIIAPYNKIKNTEYYFEEFLSLISTLEQPYDETLFLKLREIDKANFLTKGKLQELNQICQEKEIEEVIFSESLTPLQERNLAKALNCEVWDRQKLILEIFRKAATTSEGKIQVEMAEIEFLKTRLSGKGVEMAQQGGVPTGFKASRGPGETAKEMVKQFLTEKFRQAKKRLDTLQRSKEVQRQQRLASKIPLISIVGYTNAGKSSLLNTLTKSSVLAKDILFATLDTTTRELYIEKQKRALISDTVGFISQLPHLLIEAFKSTLDELGYANLLLHVVDLSNPTWQDQIKVVQKTLDELDVKAPVLYLFNKIDKLTELDIETLKPELEKYTPHVLINTLNKDGLKNLIDYLNKNI